jgi:hypothetical protein
VIWSIAEDDGEKGSYFDYIYYVVKLDEVKKLYVLDRQAKLVSGFIIICCLEKNTIFKV